ncbi:MAG: hypothetical protein JSU73_06590 [candidate division WOR-3 bacterium]|nr:MAG: hypothetical protein JSU73_06590 [candidate division WOR-3 bacterium]
MKNRPAQALSAIVALLVWTACDQVSGLDVPGVGYEVMSTGRQLYLSWDSVPGAERYRILLDDSAFTDTSTSLVVEGPVASIAVTALSQDTESPAWTLSTSATTTDEVEVWGTSATDRPNAFGFSSAGVCWTYSLADTLQWSSVDFVLDDEMDSVVVLFRSPDGLSPPLNSRDNRIAEAGPVEFDAVVSAPDTLYDEPHRCEPGRLYFLWVDPSGDGWDDDEDLFAKALVESVEGGRVVLKVACQSIPGLLWLKTD